MISKRVIVEDTSEEALDEMYRASGDMVCEQCGKNYYQHPVAGNILDWQGDPYINVICNGDLVHL